MREFSIQSLFTLVLYTECCAGITVNLIIMAVNVKKWKTLKSLPTCDKILNSLVISRSLSIFSVFLVYLLRQLNPWILLNFMVTATLLTIGQILYYTDLWFATVLCVFYCVKITSYNWKFFIFLKTKISTLVPWFLLASVMFSISSSLPFSFYIFKDLEPLHLLNSSAESIANFKAEFVLTFYSQSLKVLGGSCPPIAIFLVADCLLLHSLWMHTRRMRSSGAGFRSPNLEAHFSVVKSMSLFLVLQMVYFIFMNVLYSGVLQDYKLLRLVNVIITCSPPFLHSLYMICFCGEIKKTFISLIHSLTRCE